MKRVLLIICIAFSLSVVSQVATIPKQEKKYKVTLTVQEWTSRLNTIQAALNIMRTSTMPANTVSQWSDSLQAFQMEINRQVVADMQADSTSKKK